MHGMFKASSLQGCVWKVLKLTEWHQETPLQRLAGSLLFYIKRGRVCCRITKDKPSCKSEWNAQQAHENLASQPLHS